MLRTYHHLLARTALCALLVFAVTLPAQARKNAPAELTDQGEAHKQNYAQLMKSLEDQLQQSIPEVRDSAKADYQAALEAELKAKADVQSAKDQLAKIGAAQGLIGHARNHWIPKADRGIKAANEQLAKATTQAQRDAANAELKKWQDNRKAGEEALAERTAKYEAIKKKEPQFKQQLKQAEQNLANAQDQVVKTYSALNLDRVLENDRLDSKLAQYVVLKQATPHSLAAFAQESSANKRLIDQLLRDEKLMIEMLLSGGAKDGNYGRAMQIYTDIQAKHPKAKSDIFNRLALAVALEHATPIKQRNAEAAVDAPEFVDPIARYEHFHQAYLDNALDPYFAQHDSWELRHVVNGSEPNEVLTWGREMLANYRPDLITTKDDRWRYVALVRTCVRYGSQENKNDKPELQFYQNILMNGGICGRRAFFGRFILRSFGVPTVAKPQRGHAALGRWTPDGWAAVLGAGWNTGWAPGRDMAAPDFLAFTQARELDGYMQVKRAQWIGDVNGETRKPGFSTGRHKAEFWNSVALNTQKQLIEKAGAKALAAVGEELGEANESRVKYPFNAAEIDQSDRKINIDRNGIITIPAAAATQPGKSTGKVLFQDSVLGGKQMHYSRTGRDQDVVYTFDAPKAGAYQLSLRVTSPSWKQHVKLQTNDNAPVQLQLPHTVGMWQATEPITVQLKRGENTLTLSRQGIDQPVAIKGITIRDFTLTPVPSQR